MFIIKSTEETLSPKEIRDIFIRRRESILSLTDMNEDIKISGKLTICSKDPAMTHIKWNYYLQDF